MSRPKTPPRVRFRSFFSTGEGCWNWNGAIFKGLGYGKFNAGEGQTAYAHRFAYELAFGFIPDGMFVCHRCDNRRCVNPNHLFLGHARDNVADMMTKGRHVMRGGPGSSNGSAVLDEARVAEIRAMFVPGRRGDGVRAAREFGVSTSTISKILRGESWRHL